MKLPHPWAAYVRLQDNLNRESRLGDRSWGIEAGMDFILNAAIAAPPSHHEISRVIATARRRERHRGCRQVDMPEDLATSHPEAGLHAHHELQVIRTKISNDNWELLKAAAEGVDYAGLSKMTGRSPEILRARVSRLRKEVRVLVA